MTGATGFIGSWVAMRLLEKGHEIVALARRPEKVPSLWDQRGISCVEGDLGDRAALRRGVEGADGCIHIALGWGDAPSDMLEADTKTTVALLQLALEAGVTRFLDTSSTAAFGPFLPKMDETTPLRPDNLYGATKAAAEAFVLAVGASSSMKCNVIRPGYTFGNPVLADAPTQPDDRFRQIAKTLSQHEPLELKRGDGTQFIAASDLAELYARVIESDANREVFLGLSRPFTSWSEVADIMASGCNSRSSRTLVGEATPPCLFDLKKIRQHFDLDFDPGAALREHAEWCLGRCEATPTSAST